MSLFWGESERKRLPKDTKERLWKRSAGRCEFCTKKMRYEDAHIAHKIAVVKGGSNSIRNLMIVHPSCNLEMGTKHPGKVWKRLGKPEPRAQEARRYLKSLKSSQLRYLVKKNRIKVTGRTSEDWFGSSKLAPSKNQYILALSRGITADQAKSQLSKMPKAVPKKRKRRDTWSLW